MGDVAPFLALIVTATVCVMGVTLVRALSHRLKGSAPPPVDASVVEEIEDLRARVAGLQGQLDEVLERQDFAERMLAQVKERGALGPGPRNGGN